jgi:HSP20 family protein
MFGTTRWSPFEDVFNFQRDVDRFFTQFWNELPTRTATASPSFQVRATDDGWQIDVPMPGIDPQHVNLEVAGTTLSIRAEVPAEGNSKTVTRYEETLTIPAFLDIEKLSASHRHGMLHLTLPLKDSVKPRRIKIDMQPEEQRQLTGIA